MIDIHCHILPDLDDGAADLAEALAMADLAARDGVAEIVATPHWMGLDRLDVRELQAQCGDLQAALVSRYLPIRLHPGAELPLEPDLLSLASRGALPTLNNGPSVLVEPPFTVLPGYAEQVFFELQAYGLRPIIAHPERCAALQEDLSRLVVLVARGLLVQVNAGSLLGHYGKRAQTTACELLRRGLAHVVASDGHDPNGRTPALSAAVAQASRIVGERGAQTLVVDNPAAILAGGALVAPSASMASRRGRGWRVWFPFGGS